MTSNMPDTQLISNLVVTDPTGRILLTKRGEEDDRWWLPGEDLEPYEHPDERAKKILSEFPWLTCQNLKLANIQSFRGRRGWHVMFDYHVTATGDSANDQAAWFDKDALPKTKHGQWESDTINHVLANEAL